MKLPDYIIFVLNRLKDYEAYVVGGCVRDHLLMRDTNDYDVTTSASTDEIIDLFSDCPLVLNGLKHGTVRVIINHTSVEITTYRIDGNYVNHRQPTTVTFTKSLQEDLNRRDFTINALCYHPDTGIIDLTNGINDLNNKLIKCIGNPNKRFDEDALRILRALRFASKLQFSIDSNTSKAIHDNKQLLLCLSKERITSELKDILSINNLSILDTYNDILDTVFNTNLSYSTILHNSHDFITSISLIAIHDYSIIDKLSLSNNEKDLIDTNLKYKDILINDKKDIKHLMKANIDISSLFTFLHALYPDFNYQINSQRYLDIINNHEVYKLSQLAINGNDLIKLNIPPREISKTLNYLLSMVIDEKLVNTHDCLLSHLQLIK